MERKKKSKNSGVYIAVCSCALIVAIVGYANRLSLKESEEGKTDEIVEVVPSPTPEAKVAEVSQKAEVEEDKKEKEPTKEPEKKVEEQQEQQENETVAKKEPEVIEFTAPVKGKVIEEYLGDDLVYNETLKDWRSHSGVDFEAEIGEEVKASAKGTIEKVFDCEMGRCVIIDHGNGFRTMYANLDENTKVKEGDDIKAGDVIGTVGNTALGDITDAPHVHFEMMKDGKNVNPVENLN